MMLCHWSLITAVSFWESLLHRQRRESEQPAPALVDTQTPSSDRTSTLGDLRKAREALDRAVSGGATDAERQLTILREVEEGAVSRVKELLTLYPSLAQAAHPTGHGLVHAAARSGHAEMIPIFEDAKVDLDQQDSLVRETGLHMAVRYDHGPVVEALLDAGANIQLRNINGWTPLHDAANDGNIPLIKVLLAHGADINARESTGITPTAVAVLNDQLSAAQFLKHSGGYSHVWRSG